MPYGGMSARFGVSFDLSFGATWHLWRRERKQDDASGQYYTISGTVAIIMAAVCNNY